jgi:glutaredoxin 3
VDYRDVKTSPPELEAMLAHSGGRRDVPVIVDEGRVTIGFGGS